jgi:brefeldin A-resistance guanine nucleotide exchange factor 1
MENSVRIVKGEIHNVLSLMRLNRRYNTGARFHREIPSSAESPLVRGLKALHEDLGPYTDLQDMDTMAWLRPFLEVVESAETSGPITGGALSSLSKFLNYGFIHIGSPRAAQSVNRVCRIVTRCRFERTDHSGDEVVLVRILQVLLDCLRCPAGTLLSDQNVWDMVQSCYTIGRQARLSELLKRTAEHVLMQVTLTLFARFSQLQAAQELSLDIDGAQPLRDALDSENDADGDAGLDADADEGGGDDGDGLLADAAPAYAMPCMYKVLQFLCKLTHAGDQSDSAASEASRMLGLSLLNVVLETGGRQISACPPLVAVIQHDLSRNLLQNSRTSNLQILSLTLRVVFNMFNSVREHMKVQLEVFFNSIHLAESSLPETREMALESLVEFCGEPQLMVDIYTNYDCDMQCTNLFEDMVKFLSKNTFPLSGSLNALNLLSLEGLLAIVRSLAEACHARRSGAHEDGAEGGEEGEEEGDKTVEQLRSQKQHKRRVAMAAETFNRKPTKASTLEYLLKAGFLGAVIDAHSMSHFLRSTPGLDRTAIGEYLGDPDAMAVACLGAYVKGFDFKGMPLSQALRKFLAAFRLPGESQKIARIVEHFAAHYFEQEAGPLANADTAYILSYAIIMLNTDLHNAQVKKKMTKGEFIRMNRGINDNQDLPPEFLMEIYDSIANDEIKMKPDLSDINNISDGEPRWDNLLATMGQKYDNPFVAAPEMGSKHGRDMFVVCWDRIIAALSVVLETTEDSKVLRKAIEGLHDFAKICSFHKLHDEFNKLIATLSKSLFKFAEQAAAQPERVEEPHWVLVRNSKVQMAAQAMFTISFSHADCLRDGWKPLLDYVAKLHKIQVVPLALLEKDDFLDAHGRPLLSCTQVAIKMLHKESTRAAAKGRSIFSYLWGGDGKEEADKTSGPVATRLGMAGYEQETAYVSSLKLEELLLNTKFLSNGALAALASALIAASSRLLEEEEAEETDSTCLSVSSYLLESRSSVDAAIVFLDLLTNTALANHERIHVIWPPLHQHLQQLLGSLRHPSLTAERTVVNQLRLCVRFAVVESVRPDLMEALRYKFAKVKTSEWLCIVNIHDRDRPLRICGRALTSLSASLLQSLADRISVGLLTLLRAHGALIRDREDWRPILSLLQEFASMSPAASVPALETLTFLVREEGRVHVTANNFDFCQQTLLVFLDAVLDTHVARQHLTNRFVLEIIMYKGNYYPHSARRTRCAETSRA